MKRVFEQMKLKNEGNTADFASDPEDLEEVPAADDIAQNQDEYFEQRREVLKDIPYTTVRAAWFSLAHLLLNDGARVFDMGCGDGTLTFCMAALMPHVRFIGVDKSKRDINKAREQYELHNLEFVQSDISDETDDVLKPDSADAIINAFILHDIYSSSRYSEQMVRQTLQNEFKFLKTGGSIVIHDYPRLKPEEFILIELPDKPSMGEDLSDLSEADLLVWYSQNARVRQDPTRGGFFIEELPPRRPRTRLFRLPFKWAYEFIIRKGRRESWEKELPLEYTFFTVREFHKELRSLGARVHYSAPQWNDDYIAEHFEGKFRLFDNDGRPLETPPTSFIAVATKMRDRKSLLIEERRPAGEEANRLKISAMRNEKNGKLVDIVTPEETVSEIIPYRICESGRLKVYLHDGVARGVANAVTRSGNNLDGKRWSGHLVEPIAVEEGAAAGAEEFDFKGVVKFSRDYLGLKPKADASILKGPDYYPAPDFIDEHIYTYYLNVIKNGGPSQPRKALSSASHFQSKGEVREFDAQQILNAISVGMIPNSRLEQQILSLYQHLGMLAENWTNKDVVLGVIEITKSDAMAPLMRQMAERDHRFRDVKGTTGELRAIKSIFVEEGQTSGAKTGLHAHDLDFVVSEEKTINTAVVLPLTTNVTREVHAGFLVDHMPVPQRFAGNGATVTVPSFNLPPEIKDLSQMKKYIADKFAVMPEMVFKLGESYYTHIGVTPQRIYPFGVAAPPDILKDPYSVFIPINQFRALWGSINKSTHFMTVIARGFKYMQSHIKQEYRREVHKIWKSRVLANQTPEWSLPEIYAPPPGKDAPGQWQSEPEPDASLKAEAKAEAVASPSQSKQKSPVSLEKSSEKAAASKNTARAIEPSIRPEKW